MDTKELTEKEWNIPVDGVIYVPDVFDRVVNKVGMQFKFVHHTGKNEAQAVCDIVRGCQEFVKEFYSKNKG
jgi:hypothetical protein